MTITVDLLSVLPARRGHFLLESGYHTDMWLTLDGMFVDPNNISPLIAALADKLRPHGPTAVCGPLLGGAFLAQALASTLNTRFYYTERGDDSSEAGLFRAQYHLPAGQRTRVRGERVAVVDDIISAGSSVRATIAALTAAGASTIVVGALMMLGEAGAAYFWNECVAVETLHRCDFNLWRLEECPLCRGGQTLEDPIERDER